MITFTKEKLILSAIIVLLAVSSAWASGDNTLTITTYFPAPYGTYKELTSTGNTYLCTSGTGNVGIGTTAPQGILQVGESANPSLFVQASGNVAIGTTNPAGYKLYVKGDMYINGKLSYPATSPPGVGGGACPDGPCVITVYKDGDIGGGTTCTITIQDGMITGSTCS